MKYELIIFDLDGTLVDSSSGVIKSIEHAIDVLNLPQLSIEEKRSLVGLPIFDSFKKIYKMSDSEAEYATKIFRDIYKSDFLYDAVLYKNIFPTLVKLRNHKYKLAIASYKKDSYCKLLLKYLKIDKMFEYIQGSDSNNKLSKLEIMQKCIAKFNVNLNKILMVGDTTHDAFGSERLGVDFIGVSYGFGNKDDLHKHKNIAIIDDIEKIFDVLN
ncbi:HAD family hydrolase [Campylobacter lari]|nr:HAD family hydrolase [Campylobacter lari]